MLAAAGAGILAAGWVGAVCFAGSALVALLLGWIWQRRLTGRFGGQTGDTFGSIIEVTQTVFLVVTAMALATLA